jgi:hypothetical protein
MTMALFKASDEATAAQRAADKAAAQERKAQERVAAEQKREEERLAGERARQEAAFNRSPAGQARTCYQRGDHLFQVSIDLEKVTSHVVAMSNAYTGRHARDVSDVINSIAAEGWAFHTLSTTFVNEGEESRDRFLATGQQTAVRGRVVGTYVFTRRP